MNKPFELKICSTFFSKRSCERLYYELTSKKRPEFFRKMSHTADWYLGDCVFKECKMPVEIESILNFLNDDKCYFITLYKEFDGGCFNTSDVLNNIWANGMPYMAVDRECRYAYLETEYNFSEHTSFLLRNCALKAQY